MMFISFCRRLFLSSGFEEKSIIDAAAVLLTPVVSEAKVKKLT